ncbi:MAG: two-component system response regulator AtoC [Candidatus Latescibacterota bacterium]
MNASNQQQPVSEHIVGASEVMQQVFNLIDRIANTPATVLVTGESGTGKELIARELHQRSQRFNHAFVSVNCAAIPSNLLEAELFGYEKGAFTDAKINKKGLFEIADKGTIFLDEIGLMPLDIQAKLLTVIESHTFRHLGGTQDIHSDLRIVAATNENLSDAVREGRFRQDLYYRLNVVPLSLPPLRQRNEDILLIAHHFLNIYSSRYQKTNLKLSNGAEHWLKNYAWPGNVRELRNLIERATLLSNDNLIQLADLTVGKEENDFRVPDQPPTLVIDDLGDIRINLPPWGIAMEDVERRLIKAALQQTKGKVSSAAQLLHLSRDTLRYRIKKYKLEDLSE